MGLNLSGYVLEPVRLGQANSPFTSTPDVNVVDQVAFDAAYPSDETTPRTEYHVFALTDGRLHDASFCWTKNEVLTRFGYDGRAQRFRTLPGGPILHFEMALDLNTNRVAIPAPVSSNLALYPIRISIGPGSGGTYSLTVVPDDASFTSPTMGAVQVSQTTGNLHWNAIDLVANEGLAINCQQQQFFDLSQTGEIGVVDGIVLLNPIPATGQFPLIRIGFGSYLEPVEVAAEIDFSADPLSGTVEWAASTGRLKFNSGDIAANEGRSIYYDGACFSFDQTVTVDPIGTVSSPGTVVVVEAQDLYFRVSGFQFAETVFVDTLSDPILIKKGQAEVRRSDGQVRFSLIDQALYGAESVFAIVPDLEIERGLALRLYRTPVDLAATDPNAKDVAAFYEVVDATLADPLIGSPTFSLPATPVESLLVEAKITQGTGTVVIDPLPRLDTPSPAVGYGHILNYETKTIQLARRREDVVVTQSDNQPYSNVQLPDSLLFDSNLVLELETAPSSGTYAPLTLNEDVLLNYNAGLATLVETSGSLLTSGNAAFSGDLTDLSKDFGVLGVVQGDQLIILEGVREGVYDVASVAGNTITTGELYGSGPFVDYEIRRGPEILVDRYFQEVPPLDPNTRVERLVSLGVATNSPRLAVETSQIGSARVRFGKTGAMLTPTAVANDGAFGSPSSGVVEVSEDTGNLNFSVSDLGEVVYLARTLTFGVDFQVNSVLGFIEFSDRMLESEEVFVTYAIINDDDEKEIVEERGTFLVRKEETQAHPIPASTLTFNPLGREVAADPAPQAFRGGRPQVVGQQVLFDINAGTVTFIESAQVTDALPSGSTIAPNERVLVDYFVHEAVGGEKTLTVLRPPFVGVLITIEEGEDSFLIAGDRTSEFQTDYLLRVNNEEVYLLDTPSYDALNDVTTVILAGGQTFRSDFRNPSLALTSGPIRTTTLPLLPSYFITEIASFDPVARGSKSLFLVGDLASTYRTGTLLHWTDGVDVYEFNQVEGSVFDAESNRTKVTLLSGGSRQFGSGITLKRSVRPVVSSALSTVTTSRSPELSLPYSVYRRVGSSPGTLLSMPDDYTIDAAGTVILAEPMVPNEAIGIFYTGSTIILDGRNFRASYSHVVVPTEANGLLGQVLSLSYTTFAPDTYYWRVEPLTNYKAELAEQYSDEAKAGVPTGGPILENLGQPRLYEQGRESLSYQERRLTNEDIVARATLKWFNDGINYAEDALQSMDGRIVGDHDGRFLFDGLIDNPVRTTFEDVTNQIDDLFQVRKGPVSITMPGFQVNFDGTFEEVYKASKYSRFYPTRRTLMAAPADSTGLETGDTIASLGFTNLSAVSVIYRRQPWAVVTETAAIGTTTLTVDSTLEAETLLRPAWDTATYTYRVAITAQDGTPIVAVTSPETVATSTATTIVMSDPLPATVPAGSTIFQVFTDPLAPAMPPLPYFLKVYRPGLDIGVDLEEGELTHVEPYPPYDGSVIGFEALEIVNPIPGEILDAIVRITNATEPDRFPALDGSTLDDDRNRQFPIVGPSTDSEVGSDVGAAPQELALIETGGSIRAVTTPTLERVGTLSLGNTRITLDSGTFPAPVPKVHDLVRITSGANSGQSFRRITATDGSTYVEVTDAWASADSGFDFAVGVSTPLDTGVLSGTLLSTVLFQDPAQMFINAGVVVGHTLLILSGANAGLRRRITAVAQTQLAVEAFPTTQAGFSYRVEGPLSTYGGAGSLMEDWATSLTTQQGALSTNTPPTQVHNQIDALELFLDNFFTDVVPPGTFGQVSTGGSTLTDIISQDFLVEGVDTSKILFIRSGDNMGAYPIVAVPTAHSIDIDGVFTTGTLTQSYRIVDPGGLLPQSINSILSVLTDTETTAANVASFQALVGATVPVIGDAGAYAHGVLTSDLDTREAQVAARISAVVDPGTGHVSTISSILASSDRLYDRRFVWIDARVNMEKGILPKRDRAILNREKIEKETLKQLTKLLTLV